MRIISGIHKGKIIQSPQNLPVRPTTDFAKSGLFNMLAHRIEFKKCKVLDLFAGTGNISFEFISRGAYSVTAVDSNNMCIKFIKTFFEKLNAEGATAIKAEVSEFIKGTQQQFDIIFADPPFETDDYGSLIETVITRKSLTDNGIFILEHHSKNHFIDHQNFIEERKFGNVTFSFFKQQ